MASPPALADLAPVASGPEEAVLRAVLDTLPVGGSVLAVSGGRDSMTLLDAAARVAPERIARVAAFNHGTGLHATRAVMLVRARAESLGLPVSVGRAVASRHDEASWRAARWAFLRGVASDAGAPVATAHTQDDQVETILLRILRGAGARGIAALAAPSPIVRPLLRVTRAEVTGYARQRRLEWVDDPSNGSRAYARNRARLDLLPALARRAPMLADDLLALGDRAAALRAELEVLIEEHVTLVTGDESIEVAGEQLAPFDATGLRLLWPALAARAGVTLDRRGTERLTQFTMLGRPGSRIQLSGGFEALRHRESIRVRRIGSLTVDAEVHDLVADMRFGSWRFYAIPERSESDGWHVPLPSDGPLLVRGWLPGDRMRPDGEAVPRRLKGLLRDAGIAASDRRGWPVVLAAGEIVWVPGVRRSLAATDRSGKPVTWFCCERAAP